MATITQVPARLARTVSGGAGITGVFPEAASQSFKAGEFVYLVSGKVTVCADDATSILGMAAHDASGTTNTNVIVYLAHPDNVFEANVYHSTPASAVTAITQVGVNYALQVDSNKSYVDIEDTSHDAFVVIGISEKDAVGDVYGRVHFQVLNTVAQLTVGS